MKILLVSNGLPPTAYGGVEIYVKELAHSLVDRGHQVAVFARESDRSSPDYRILEEQAGQVRVFRLVNDYKSIHSFEQTYANEQVEVLFRRVLSDMSPEIVHFNHFIALSGRLPRLSIEQGIPTVLTLHDYWPLCHRVNLIDWRRKNCPGPANGADCVTCIRGGEDTLRTRFMKAVKKALPWSWRQWYRINISRVSSTNFLAELTPEMLTGRYDLFKSAILSCDKIMTPSEYVRTQYIQNGYPAERFDVLPLGIQYSVPQEGNPARKSGEKGVVFAFIGTLIPIKGVHVLLKAFKRLKSGNVHLNIYGREDAGPVDYIHSLKVLARGDERISFRGPFKPEEKGSVYLENDVVVIPSIAPETFSMVAREALITGKPVIASDVGALPEVIQNDANGFLFPPGDEQALFSILERIVENQTILDNLDCPGPARIYSASDHSRLIEAIYDQVVSLRNSTGKPVQVGTNLGD